jgi:non-canonical poly(A) RNA polymerase PAPD5/7
VAAVERVRSVVVSIWPGARLEVFGSCATGLYLPTSDVDAVILDSGCSVPGDGLRALALAVTRRGVGQRVALIAKARIPIIKFTEATSGLAFDISFDVANGPAAAAWMRAAMGALPPLRPLTLVLKAFLQQRELNEVYSGGVGSYALVVMLVALLRTHDGEWGPEPNLGALLLAFLDLYGRQLNAEAVGVSASGFFNKAQRGWCDERRPELLAVEDPRDAANDLTRNSFNARAIRIAFEHAHRLLSAPAETRTESLLGRVVHLDTALTGRAQLQSQGPIAAQPSVINQQQQQPGPGEGAATPGESKRQRKKKRAAQAAALAAAQLEEGELPDEDGGEELDAPPRKKGKKARRAAE